MATPVNTDLCTEAWQQAWLGYGELREVTTEVLMLLRPVSLDPVLHVVPVHCDSHSGKTAAGHVISRSWPTWYGLQLTDCL